MKVSLKHKLSFKNFIGVMTIIMIAGLVYAAYLYIQLYGLPIATDFKLKDYRPVTQTPTNLTLELNNPDDQTLSFDKNIIVSGKTASHATVLISTDNNDQVIEASNTGDFSQVVPLSSGLNQLLIMAFNLGGDQKQITRTVYYSEEKL